MIEIQEYNTIGSRLKKVVKDTGLTIEKFVEPINVDRGQFGKVLKDNMGVTTNQILEISSHYGVRTGWILEGELPVYKKEISGKSMPDNLLTLRRQLNSAIFNLQEAMKTLPVSAGPDISAVRNPAYRQGKKKKTEKQ